LYGACEPCLLVVEVRVEQQARDPQDAVQRRADLVAHVGEEGALRKQRPLHFAKPECELATRLTAGRGMVARASASPWDPVSSRLRGINPPPQIRTPPPDAISGATSIRFDFSRCAVESTARDRAVTNQFA